MTTIDNTLLLLDALHFAADKHRDHRRKDVHASPYINHPIHVAQILAKSGGVSDPEVLAAAVLHDTVEDTETTLLELRKTFGPRVEEMVGEVTDDKTLDKLERKQGQIEHAQHLSHGGALVKIADKIANVSDVAQNPPPNWDDARRQEYLNWAAEVVSNCPRVNPALEAEFWDALERARRDRSKLDQLAPDLTATGRFTPDL